MSQGANYTVIQTPVDFGLQVQRGQISGVSFVNKFGRNADTVAGDAIWAASSAYVEPATAELCNVVSSSTNDAAAGTGARTIYISGINENYDIASETLTLNGTSNVSTVNRYFNIHRAYVSTAGSGGTAAGNITITSTAAGTPAMALLSLGYNQTQSTVYMVPRNYTAYINLPNVSGQNTTANALCDIICTKKEFGGVPRIQMDFHLIGGNMAYMPKVFGAPLKFEAKSICLFKCTSNSGGGTWDVAIDYDIWLVAD